MEPVSLGLEWANRLRSPVLRSLAPAPTASPARRDRLQEPKLETGASAGFGNKAEFCRRCTLTLQVGVTFTEVKADRGELLRGEEQRERTTQQGAQAIGIH